MEVPTYLNQINVYQLTIDIPNKGYLFLSKY